MEAFTDLPTWFISDSIPPETIYLVPKYKTWTITCQERYEDRIALKSKTYYIPVK